MTSRADRPFSLLWVAVSMATFIAVELLVGGLIGPFLQGRYTSIALGFSLQGLLNLLSYLVGGFLVAVISPGIRIAEPAAGAFCSVALVQILTLFTPSQMLQPDRGKMLIGGVIALVLATVGATAGETLMGNLKK
jgi:hypothetical protein